MLRSESISTTDVRALYQAVLPKWRKIRFVVAITILATGCTSGPDYHSPSIPKTAGSNFINQPVHTDTAVTSLANWWMLYKDPALDGLVKEALSANTDVRVALANLDRAHAIIKEARGDLYPSTNISAGTSYGRDQTTWTGNGQAPKQWSNTGGLNVSYELDLFGRVKREIEAAQDDTDVVAAAYDAARVVVVAETTRAYVDACSYGESIDVARSSIDLSHRSLVLISSQEQAGSASGCRTRRCCAGSSRGCTAAPAKPAKRCIIRAGSIDGPNPIANT